MTKAVAGLFGAPCDRQPVIIKKSNTEADHEHFAQHARCSAHAEAVFHAPVDRCGLSVHLACKRQAPRLWPAYSASCACSDGRASFSRARSACRPGTCQDADTCMGGTGMHDMQSQPPHPRRPCSGTSGMGSAPAAACTGHRWGVRHSSRALSVSCLLLLQGVSCARITRARKNRPPA